MNARYAIYFIPESGTALAALGSALLGRDSEMGLEIRQAELPGFSATRFYDLTSDARRYGLHATLKAPFFLKTGTTEQEFLTAAARFVMGRRGITLPRLELARIGSFFALIPSRRTPVEEDAAQRVNALAADAVVFFNSFRAALSEQELARRNPDKLNARQRLLLIEWGYPYVFDEYRFHITLTDTIRDISESQAMSEGLRSVLMPVCDESVNIASICICKQEMDIGNAKTNVRSNDFMLLKRIQMIPPGGNDGYVAE